MAHISYQLYVGFFVLIVETQLNYLSELGLILVIITLVALKQIAHRCGRAFFRASCHRQDTIALDEEERLGRLAFEPCVIRTVRKHIEAGICKLLEAQACINGDRLWFMQAVPILEHHGKLAVVSLYGFHDVELLSHLLFHLIIEFIVLLTDLLLFTLEFYDSFFRAH